jgi:hypothetical protein
MGIEADVWLDEQELRVGYQIHKTLDRALSICDSPCAGDIEEFA